MLEIQKYLKDAEEAYEYKLGDLTILKMLEDKTGIKHSIWEDKLVVLNYCQINSDKNLTITQECRSLVLEIGTWKVVSRSFDRFFNYGETQCPDVKVEDLVAFEKVDGSLIGIFHYQGEWLYRTRSIIMPTGVINGNAQGVTWKDRIEEVLGGNYRKELTGLEDTTFIGELTCRENRVVTKYAYDGGRFHILAARCLDGTYMSRLPHMLLLFRGAVEAI